MRRGLPRNGLRRVAAPQPIQARAEMHTFVPPIRGLVLDENITGPQPGGAAVLENFFPRTTGAKVRRGSVRHATIGTNALAFDGQTGNFTVGQVVTGGTSGATGTIASQTDGGSSGTLQLHDIDGTFADNEALTDPLGGAAVANIPSGVTARGPVESMITYRFGGTEKLFAAHATSIFEVGSPVEPDETPAATVDGQTSGDYSVAPFETAGLGFVWALNGTDLPRLYDGTTWHQIFSTETYGLAYDGGTVLFSVGATVTGGTSGATGVVAKVVGNATSGTLHIRSVTGTFQNDENLTGGGGAAVANIPSGVSTITAQKITGLSFTLDKLICGCAYRNRMFFARKNTMTAVYLPVEVVSGAASSLNLTGVFTKGGWLEFIATWSSDAGDGIDDRIVFVTNQGEAAVYSGSFADAGNISFVGRFDIGSPPLGKNAFLSVGGDLIIMTQAGWIPMSQVVGNDETRLSAVAVTAKIETLWRKMVNDRGSVPWQAIRWPERGVALISLPKTDANQDRMCLVFNVETMAAAIFTGWDVRSLARFDGNIYFGTSDGKIMLADSGGSDDGSAYVARAAGLAERLAGGLPMTARLARAAFEYSTDFNMRISIAADYGYDFPAPPAAMEVSSGGAALWDSALWDQARWDQGLDAPVKRKSNWEAVGGYGFALAWQVQITIGSDVAPDIELQSIDLTYEIGNVVTG